MTAIQTGLLWFMLEDLSTDVVGDVIQEYTYVHPYEPDVRHETYILLKDRIGLPYGDMEKVKRVIGRPFTILDRRVSPSIDIQLHGLTLRDYQETAMQEIDSLLDKGCTSFNLSGAPGSGKSVVSSAIVSKLGVRTLYIGHMSMLVKQLFDEVSSVCDANCVLLDAKTKELGDINFATSQFISLNPDLWYKIKHDIGLLIVDEAESLGATSTMRILQRAHAKYRMAITATFTRSMDRRTEALHDLIGHDKVVLDNPSLIKPSIFVVRNAETFSAPVNKNLYKKSVHRFLKQSSIQEKVKLLVMTSLTKGRQVFIAIDVQDTQRELAEMLNAEGVTTGILNATTPKKERTDILKKFNNQEVEVLLGFGVLNAGLSIPRISVIIRLSTPSSIEKHEQLIGRGRRDFPGKEGIWVFDMFFNGMHYANEKRYNFYRNKRFNEGWTVSDLSWNNMELKLKGA